MFRNILKITTGTLISRVFGFIREMVVASYFGTGKIADAFTLALIFPNLFRQILGEDMVERAFMPPFKRIYDKGNQQQSWKFISVVFNWFFIFLMLATFILYLIVPLFFSLKDSFPNTFGFIFSDREFDYDLTMKLILVVLPFTVFIGVAAFVGSILNFFEKNWIFGFAPMMLSVGVIVGVAVFEPLIGGYSIALGYVIGAFLQMLIQIPFLINKKFRKETGFKYHFRLLKDKENDYQSVKRESRFITLNAVFDKIQEVFGRFFASTLVQGSTSSLFYAIRLFQLPFAIISLSITRGINPELNRLRATGDLQGFNKVYQKGLNLYILFFFPFTAIFMVISPELIDIVYQRGQFSATSLKLTADAFSMYCVGLLPMSLVGYYKRVLSVFDKNKYALNISVISAFLNILFSVVLVKTTQLGHSGIALAASLAYVVNMFVMNNYIKKELQGYVEKGGIALIHKVILIILTLLIIYITRHFDLYYFHSKTVSLISIGIKTLLVSIIFLIYYLLSNNIRHNLSSFLKR